MRLPRLPQLVSLNLALAFRSTCHGSEGGRVLANLVGAKSTGESVPAAVATVSFRNDSATAVSIRSYRLWWPGGTFSADPKGLRIPAHFSIEHKVRLDLSNGDIAALLDQPQQVKIELAWRRSD
jgi:hypothetical protein